MKASSACPIAQLADIINQDCEEYRYFWAFGTLKATAKLWRGENRALLTEYAQAILSNVEQSLAEQH